VSLDRTRLPDAASFYEGEGLTLNGAGKWRTACCPLHGGRSLRINVESGAFACMGGCELRGGDVIAYLMRTRGLGFSEACKQLGAWADDGTPAPKRAPRASALSARDRLEVLYRESLVLFVVGCDVRNGREINEQDWHRFGVALARINHVAWRVDE
jgi:DNA primase